MNNIPIVMIMHMDAHSKKSKPDPEETDASANIFLDYRLQRILPTDSDVTHKLVAQDRHFYQVDKIYT